MLYRYAEPALFSIFFYLLTFSAYAILYGYISNGIYILIVVQEREDFMASDSTTSRERSGSPPTSPVAVAGSSSTGLPRTSAELDLDLEREVSVSPPPLHSGRVKEIAWYSWREWHDVYADVFSEYLLKCCTALLTMGCWKERSRDYLWPL